MPSARTRRTRASCPEPDTDVVTFGAATAAAAAPIARERRKRAPIARKRGRGVAQPDGTPLAQASVVQQATTRETTDHEADRDLREGRDRKVHDDAEHRRGPRLARQEGDDRRLRP